MRSFLRDFIFSGSLASLGSCCIFHFCMTSAGKSLEREFEHWYR